MAITNPDVQAVNFNNNLGEFSAFSDECFQKHLEKLANGKTQKFKYRVRFNATLILGGDDIRKLSKNNI